MVSSGRLQGQPAKWRRNTATVIALAMIAASRTCEELARLAAELLSPTARTCDQWKQWVRTCERYLWWFLWKTQAGHVDGALIPAMLRFVEKHSRDTDPASLCLALPAHQPAIEDVARLPWRMPQVASPLLRNVIPARVRWVRCERHSAWCGVGVSKDNSRGAYDSAKRWVVAIHLIAKASRSCDEFYARRKQVSQMALQGMGNAYYIKLTRLSHGKWKRTDNSQDAVVNYSAAAWEALAPALAPWETVAATALGG
jgi:hypothetical protein